MGNFISSFMSNESSFGRVMTKIGIIICANLMFVFFSIPVVTIGASLTAMYHVMLKTLRGKGNINPMHTPGVLVKNHGPFSWGKNPDNAVYNSVVMEQVAKMAFVSFCVNPATTMNPLLVEKHFSRKHGPNAYYGQKKK